MKIFLFLLIGLILGPSALKLNFPSVLSAFATVCANMFLLVAGLELSFKALRRQLASAGKLSLGAFLLPFITGGITAMLVLRDTPLASASSFIFISVALAISALPITIQILKDINLYHTEVGRLIIATATLCDILAWIVFAFIIPGEGVKAWFLSHLSLMFFFLGLGLSDTPYPSTRVRDGLVKLNRILFGPVFFVSIGWKLNLWQNLDWAQVCIVFLLASASKLGGSYWMARNMGFGKKRSALIGLSLNSRGAVEIIVANVALQQHLISEKIFTTLVMLAVVTSLLPEPLTHLLKLHEDK